MSDEERVNPLFVRIDSRGAERVVSRRAKAARRLTGGQ
jgi:hypothetical protein